MGDAGTRQGRQFRRRHSVGPFVLDFYCSQEKLAVELGGRVHADPVRHAYDAGRTASLETPDLVADAIAIHFGGEVNDG